MRGTVGGDEGVLDGVGGLLAVPQRPQRHRPQPVAVAAHEFPERLVVAADMTGEEVLIAHAAVPGLVRHPTPSHAGVCLDPSP